MKYHVDELEVNDTLLILSGWISTSKDNLVFIIIIDGVEYIQSVILHERNDVYEYFKKKCSINTGFHIELNIPKQYKYHIKVVVKDGNKKINLCHKTIINNSAENSIIHNMEMIRYGNDNNEINIGGWVFSTLDDIPVTVTATVNRKKYAIASGKNRYDVQKVFSNFNYSNKSGFSGKIVSNRPITSMKITFSAKSGAEKTVHYDIADYCSPVSKKEKKTLQKVSLYMNMLYETIRKIYRDIRYKNEALTYNYLRSNYKTMLNEYNRGKSKELLMNLIDMHNPEDVWESNNTLSNDLISELLDNIKKPVTYTIFLFISDKSNIAKSIQSIENQIYDNYNLYLVTKANDYIKLKKQYTVISINELNKILVQKKVITHTIFMQDNCLLRKEALLLLNFHLNSDGNIYYSDSKLNQKLFFKPDWSPQHILSNNYIGNFFVINNLSDWKNQYLDEKYDTAILYNFVLQALLNGYIFKHISSVYYDEIIGKKTIKYQDYIDAVQSYLNISKIRARVVLKEYQKDMYPILKLVFNNTGPDVDIIIPTKNQYSILKDCVSSLLKSSYENYTITIIDNESNDKRTIEYLNELSKNDKIKILPVKNKKDGIFSYSYVNNYAVKQSRAEYVLFLNNDTEVRSKEWLSGMIGYVQFKNVGIVGAKLMFSDDRIQHAGLVMGLNDGMVAPAFKLLPKAQKSYMNYSNTTRNYSAVTAACLLIRKDLFMDVGMFDEEKFSVAYNDVDLCLRVLNEQKKDIVFVAEAELYHYEGTTRGYVDKIDETLAFKEKYHKFNDGFYNVNLSLENEWFKIDTANHINIPNFNLSRHKIVAVSHNLNFEGAPWQLFDVINGLKKYEEFEFEIWSPFDGPLREIIEKNGIKVRILDTGTGRNIPTEIDNYETYRKEYILLFKEDNISGVIANTLESFYAVNYAAEAGIPAIWMIHESVDYEKYYNYLSQDMQKKYIQTFNNAYKLLFVADATKSLYSRVDGRHSSITIHNSIKTAEIEQYKNTWSKQTIREKLCIENDKVIGVMVGTVCERKGQKDIVYAVQKLKQKYPDDDICIYIVGGRNNQYTEDIKALIKEHKLENNIKIIMETKDVFQYYTASDYFVFTSYNESYPRVMIEAMLFGLPVITTNVFGIKEQIFENINGFLFNPGDIESFTEKIHLLISDKCLLKEYSQNCLKAAKYLNNYDWMIEKYYKLIYQMFFVNYKK